MRDVDMKKQKRAKPRGYRSYPQTNRVLSLNFPEGLKDVKEKCFVPLKDYNKLNKKYLALFKRYQRSKDER
jgi:hypothetical protein